MGGNGLYKYEDTCSWKWQETQHLSQQIAHAKRTMRSFSTSSLLALAVAVSGVAAQDFEILRHVGGNGQWFPGTVYSGGLRRATLTTIRPRGD